MLVGCAEEYMHHFPHMNGCWWAVLKNICISCDLPFPLSPSHLSLIVKSFIPFL